MARLDEIAQGLATVLQHSKEPEPLSVDLWNHSPVEAAFLVRAIVDTCERSAVPISLVRIGAQIGSKLGKSFVDEPLSYQGVRVELVEDLGDKLELYRFPVN